MSDYPFPEIPDDDSGGSNAVTIGGQPIATTLSGGVTIDPGDIEIGAVEIKNGADDTRAIVTTAAPGVNDAGLVVRIAGGAVGGGLTDAQLRATPVPVSGTIATGALTDTQLRATPVPVSGVVTVSDGSGPLTVDGTVAVSGSVAVTGPATDAQLRATPLPVSGTVVTGGLTDTQLRATPVPVSGSVTVSDGSGPLTVDGTVAVSGSVAVTGPLTDTQLRASAVDVNITGGAGSGLTDTQLRATPVPVSGPATDTQLRATPLPVSGTVAVSGNVEVTNDVGNPLPVSGPLTDTQLRATPVPVSGSVTVSDGSGPLTVDGTVAVSGSVAVTGPLTDTQLRATPVPVSGTVTATGGLTDAQLRATAVPVSGPATDAQLRATPLPVSGTVGVSGNVEVTNDVGNPLPVSGTVTANAGTGPFPVSDNAGSLTVDAPVATPVFVRLSDGAASIATLPVSGPLTDTQLRATPVPVSGTVTATTGGLTDTQLRATAVPVSGPLTDTQLRATAVPVSGTVTATGPLTDTQLRATAVPVSGTVTAVQSVTQDYDTSGGTLNQPTNGVVVPSATGPIAITGDAANGLDVDVTRVSGTVTTSGVVTNVTPGGGATDLGKAEDAPHTSGDTGVFALAVRNDANTLLAGTNLDYIPFSTDSTGALRTLVTGNITTVTTVSSVSAVTAGTGAGNLGKAEDAAHASSDTGVMALGRRIDAEASSAGTSGDYATLDTDGVGRLRTVAAPNPVTATLVNVPGSASSVTLIAANAARRGWVITNDSTQLLFVKLGTPASTTSYTYVIPAATATQIFSLEQPYGLSYQGDITGIMPSANGNARTTELVAA